MSWYDTVDVVRTKLNGVRIDVRAMEGNVEFQRKQNALKKTKLTKSQISGRESIDPETEREILAEAIAGTVLVDWDAGALAKAEGAESPIAFTEEHAAELLKRRKFLMRDIIEIAAARDAYLTENYEITEGK